MKPTILDQLLAYLVVVAFLCWPALLVYVLEHMDVLP